MGKLLADRHYDQTVHTLAPEKIQMLYLKAEVLICVADDQAVAVLMCHPLYAAAHIREERIRNVGQHQSYSVRLFDPQTAGKLVWPVIKLGSRFENYSLRIRADPVLGCFLIQNSRYCRDRNPRDQRDIS